MLRLTSKGLMKSFQKAEGYDRTTVVAATATTVGIVAGKRGDADGTALIAVGVGAAAVMLKSHNLGEGALAGGMSLLGYKYGTLRGY